MKRAYRIFNGLVAVVWVSLALGISMKIALLGNEEAVLKKSRGADFRVRTDEAYKQERLRAQLDQATAPSALEAAMKQCDLHLQPPVRYAGR